MVSLAYPIDKLDWAFFSVVILSQHWFPLLEKHWESGFYFAPQLPPPPDLAPKGRFRVPKRMNFREGSKRPMTLTPSRKFIRFGSPTRPILCSEYFENSNVSYSALNALKKETKYTVRDSVKGFCASIYWKKGRDLVGWHRCLTHSQTTEYSATQLV